MPGLEADTSSYNQQLPVGALDQVQKLGALKQQQQQIESGSLTIDAQKLANANTGLTYLTRAMTSLGPDASKDDYKAVGANAVKMGLVPAQQLQVWNERVDAAPDSKTFYNEVVTAAASHQEAINYHLGQRQDVGNGQQVTPSVTSVKPGFGVRPIANPIQQQIPPTTETVDNQRTLPTGERNPNYGGKGLVGPRAAEIPAGGIPAGGVPGQYKMPVAPRTTGPTGPTIRRPDLEAPQPVAAAPASFADRFAAARPGSVATSLPPGAGEAVATGAAAGATAAAAGRARASNFQREIFPLMQAIPALEKLGPKGTGPGTETINNLKSFAISNIPGVKESDFNNTVADYDKAKKYLTDFVNQTGNSGTNDKLAAAFAGNPSVGISNAAAVDVAKSALSLRRMQQAEDIAFEKSGLPDEDRQKFSLRFNSEQDPRAYGVDMIGKEKLKKLVEGMSAEELATFKKSVEIAHSTKSIPPIGSR